MNCEFADCKSPSRIHFLEVNNIRIVSERHACRNHADLIISRATPSRVARPGNESDGLRLITIEALLVDQDSNTGSIFVRDVATENGWSMTLGIVDLGILDGLLRHRSFVRPPTHSACLSIIAALGGTVLSGVVDSADRTTAPPIIRAKICLRQNEESVEVDIRPSDMFALATVAQCPIYVREGVLD